MFGRISPPPSTDDADRRGRDAEKGVGGMTPGAVEAAARGVRMCSMTVGSAAMMAAPSWSTLGPMSEGTLG
jgi:hypothetical protein